MPIRKSEYIRPDAFCGRVRCKKQPPKNWLDSAAFHTARQTAYINELEQRANIARMDLEKIIEEINERSLLPQETMERIIEVIATLR